MPASIILVIAGVVMVIDAWSFGDLWILLGIAGFIYSVISGAVFLGPLSGKTGKMIEERGPEDPEVQANLKRLNDFARVELIVLIVVVFAMTTKPTL